jgi:formylglycine-generating enzyme required for sulfatase activity
MDAILFHPETSIRRALIQALGTYGPDALSRGEREPLTAKLLDLYKNDPDSGIHAAAEWTLRQWNEQAKFKAAEAKLPNLKDRGDRRWFTNSQGQTFALIEGPVEFTMGSPPTEPDRDAEEVAHRRRIPRKFAIAAKEVSVRQYQEFVRENPDFGFARSHLDKYSPDPDGPMIAVSGFGAAAYCNWLSRKENLPECYEPNDQGQYGAGMKIRADALVRTGYRLPTEAEWEYACRAGTVTSRYHGLSLRLLTKYARYAGNSAEHAWLQGGLLPNDLGLFDMLGNVFEWCQDANYSYRATAAGAISDQSYIAVFIDIITSRLLRGAAFTIEPANVRSADRSSLLPANRSIDSGLRLARTWRGMIEMSRTARIRDLIISTPEYAAKSRPPSRAGQRRAARPNDALARRVK